MNRSSSRKQRLRQVAGVRPAVDGDESLRRLNDELAAARATAERLRVHGEEIGRQMRARSLFLANLSHELRSPLNAVIGFADLLRSGAIPPDSPKRDLFLEHIHTSGRHLLQLIEDVLEMSKIDAGSPEFVPEPVELERLVARVVDLLHTRIVRKRLAIVIDVEPGLDGISVDPGRLKQALLSYLTNAVEYAPEGSRVTVRAVAHGPDRFRLEVIDSGAGIAQGEGARAFDEFARTDGRAHRPPDGTGLELALTRRLVEAQGGEVGVVGAPDPGNTYFLVLDRMPHAGGPGDAQAPAATGPGASSTALPVDAPERGAGRRG